MNEVNSPEKKIEGQRIEQTVEQMRSREQLTDRISSNLDTIWDVGNIENADSKDDSSKKDSETIKNQRENNLDALDIDGKLHKIDSAECEVHSVFSRENFKIENSFDARAKTEHPELTDLKSKCVYDVHPMGTPDDHIDRSPKAEYTAAERKYIKDIRENIDAPTSETKMQKVIAVDTGNLQKDLSNYLEPKTLEGKDTVAQVYGFISKAEDVVPFTKTPQECHDNLRLDYTGTKYTNPDQAVYVIRFTDGINYDIPYSEEFDGNKNSPHPFTGNGFISAKDFAIPEYEVRKEKGMGAVISNGEIYRIDPTGTDEPVAYFDELTRRFVPYERSENL